jgi:hypothetical protein
MQRLKQHNSGAALPLEKDELLSASTTQTLPQGGWCHVRMRLAINGEAERSVHLYDTSTHSAFHHERIVVPPAVVAELSAAVRAAFAERESLPEDEDDSQALYRTITVRESDGELKSLAVQYEYERAVGPAVAFETAWRLLAALFPSTHAGQQVIPGLVW